MLKTFFALLSVATLCMTASANALETRAKQAILIDAQTGAVLFEKNGDEQMPPSSMAKLMTLYVLFDRLKAGGLKLDDTFTVSERAWRMQGSKMFVELNNQISVEDLIRGIVIQSGNDACVVVAEGISGTEEAFADEMNRVGAKLGLKNSHFTNSTGWPDEKMYMSARDLALLSHHLVSDFPDYYHYFAETEFTYHGIVQHNRNLLLSRNIGVDGLKTGHTEIAGYGISLSAKDEKTGRRLYLVINGLEDDKARVEEGASLLQHGFRDFENKKIVNAGEVVDEIAVWLGKADKVALVAEKDVLASVPKGERGKMTLTMHYQEPVAAPIEKGQKLADLHITIGDAEPQIVSLIAAQAVEPVSRFGRIMPALRHVIGQ